MHMRPLIVIIALTIALLAATAYGDECADFTLEDLDGDLITLSDFYGEGPILINFWATWCTPCKNELPHLQKLWEEFEDQGFTLITISEDSPKSQAKISPYVKSKKFTFKVLLDPDKEVLTLLQGSTLPYRVLLDSDGTIIETHQGYNPGDELTLKTEIEKLLNGGSADE